MNFSCDACGRAYSVADEKVQGRAFRITCRQCGKEIRVPASRPQPTAGRPATAPPVPAPAAPPPAATAPARPPPAPPRPPPPAPPHATPPMTRVAGQGAAPPAGGLGMTDEEMAWLAGESTRPRAPAPPAEPGEVRGSTTDVEAAAAALGALEDTGGKLPGAPVPAAEPPSDGLDEDTSGRPRGPGRLRIAAAALLVAAAGVVAAWQLGWLSPRPKPPPAPVAKAAPAAAAPAAPTPAEVTPPEAAPPEGTPAAPAEATPGAAAAAAPDEVAPAPAPGPVKRGAGPRTGADRKKPNLRIARKDRRLLDLLEKKGDTAPAAPVETSTLDTGLAELDQPAVERALEENRPAFAVCVTRALKADPKLRVDDRKATLMLTVRPNGTVAKAWVAEADLEGTLLGSCLASAARRVVFPAFQGEALEVSAPLVLGAIR